MQKCTRKNNDDNMITTTNDNKKKRQQNKSGCPGLKQRKKKTQHKHVAKPARCAEMTTRDQVLLSPSLRPWFHSSSACSPGAQGVLWENEHSKKRKAMPGQVVFAPRVCHSRPNLWWVLKNTDTPPPPPPHTPAHPYSPLKQLLLSPHTIFKYPESTGVPGRVHSTMS